MSQEVYCNVATQNVTMETVNNERVMEKIEKLRRELGRLVRSARESKHMSQAGLAKIIGVDRQTIYRIEAAKTGTTRETGLALVEALDLDEKQILGLIAGMDTPEINIPDDFIIEGFDGLDQSDIDKIVHYIRFTKHQKDK